MQICLMHELIVITIIECYYQYFGQFFNKEVIKVIVESNIMATFDN